MQGMAGAGRQAGLEQRGRQLERRGQAGPTLSSIAAEPVGVGGR